MKELFCKYFEGYFDNQTQAFTRPQDFALILVNHKLIDEDTFKVTQQYVYETEPYRETVIKVIENNDSILIKNYKSDGLTYLSGCDTIFEFNDNQFHGKNCCNECLIHRNGKDTYLMTEIYLGNGYYNVIDRGFDVETNQHVWGSFNGFFEFIKK
jgi:CpeT protein